MLARCASCDTHWTGYAASECERCPSCGETKAYCTHLDFPQVQPCIPRHEVLVDLTTGKAVGSDPCDQIWPPRSRRGRSRDE